MNTGRGFHKLLGRGALVGLGALAMLGASSLPAHAGASGNGVTHSGGQAGSNSNGSTNAASGETSSVPVCSTAPEGYASCDSQRRTDASAVGSAPSASPASGSTVGSNGAYGPAWLQAAYQAPSATSGGGQTVAIVDAYDDPSAYSDLTLYRSYWGLSACSNQAPAGSTPCFRQVNESGASSPLPSANAGWAQEISLDLDMVSAICPNCNILLVEAASASYADLGTAVDTAVSMGAQEVSNSYGGGEFSSELSLDSYYNHPGTAVVASSGDSGYGVEYPAASPYVTSVGGTTLNQSGTSGRNATETAWSGAGSGCSVYEAKPSWQTDTGCRNRTVADVSAVANPNTGVWVYDTYSSGGGWGIFGGTSVASPIVASFFALGAKAGTSGANPPSWPYANTTALNDVTSGSNGRCSGSYLCTAGTGYDGPTGLGTPKGSTAFSGGSTGGGGVGPGPFTLSATSDRSHGVDLSWTLSANTSGAASYTVLRSSSSSGSFTSPPTVPKITCGPSSCSAVDGSTSGRSTYWYEVVASNPFGAKNSNVVSARAR